MHRFSPFSSTLDTLSALLHPDEHILLSQPNTGLYNGKDKSPPHQLGSLVLTTHRLLFVSSPRPHRDSVALDLARVRQTEYWGGFLKSSAKITLTVDEDEDSAGGGSATGQDGSAEGGEGVAGAGGGASGKTISDPERAHQLLASSAASRSWVCRVCGMRNTPSARCSLCGVPNDELSSTSASTTSASAPTSRFSTPPPRPPLPPSLASPATAPPAPTSPAVDPKEAGARLSCPVCTFLNHHSMTSCEVCGSSLFPTDSSTSPSPRAPPMIHAKTQPSSTSSSPAPTPRPSTPSSSLARPNYVRLSFRAGGASAFYTALKRALGEKKWEVARPASKAARAVGAGGKKGEGEEGVVEEGAEGVGIDAILRSLSLTTTQRESTMDDALRDLESLMGKAKEMIALAQSISQQATALSAPAPGSSSTTPSTTDPTAAAASLASSSLLSLGVSSPSSSSLLTGDGAVTAADAKTEREYHLSLARELLTVLEGGKVVDRMGGIVGLDEVWCFWNRARGVALVPPSDMRHAVSLLSSLPGPSSSTNSSASRSSSPPLALRTFPSTNLSVLHTPHYSLPAFTRRLLDLLELKAALVASLSEPEYIASLAEEDESSTGTGTVQREGVDLLELAREEGGVSVSLVRELLQLVELGDPDAPLGSAARKGGRVCRDEQVGGGGAGVRWYGNWIGEGGWDGQVF